MSFSRKFLQQIDVISASGGFSIMRYTNPRFTKLLIYIFIWFTIPGK